MDQAESDRLPVRVRTVCVPASDWVFTRAVNRIMAAMRIDHAGDLEAALAPMYPQVRVRRRELSGEPIETWYVYRDHRFPAKSDEAG